MNNESNKLHSNQSRNIFPRIKLKPNQIPPPPPIPSHQKFKPPSSLKPPPKLPLNIVPPLKNHTHPSFLGNVYPPKKPKTAPNSEKMDTILSFPKPAIIDLKPPSLKDFKKSFGFHSNAQSQNFQKINLIDRQEFAKKSREEKRILKKAKEKLFKKYSKKKWKINKNALQKSPKRAKLPEKSKKTEKKAAKQKKPQNPRIFENLPKLSNLLKYVSLPEKPKTLLKSEKAENGKDSKPSIQALAPPRTDLAKPRRRRKTASAERSVFLYGGEGKAEKAKSEPPPAPFQLARPLRSRRISKKHPHIGADFQVDKNAIPKARPYESFATRKRSLKAEVKAKILESLSAKILADSVDWSYGDRYAGRAVWKGSRLYEEDVDEYLRRVKNLFPSKKASGDHLHLPCRLGFSLEKALFLLHRCSYNINDALYLVDLKTITLENESNSFKESEELFEEGDACFDCGDGGSLILCDFFNCKRVFHARCVKIEKIPAGEWYCPGHFCLVCGSKSERSLVCSYCPNAYCAAHLPRELGGKNEVEFICKDCDAQNLDPKQRFYQRLHELLRRKHEVLRNHRVGGIDIDFFAFYAEVVAAGGARRVTDSMGWSKIRKALRISETSTNASSLLKSVYKKNLLAYEKLYFPDYLPLEFNDKARRGRPKTQQNKPETDQTKKETCDIMIEDYSNNTLRIRANLNGVVKSGFLFVPTVLKGTAFGEAFSNESCEENEADKSGENDSFGVSVKSLSEEISANISLDNPHFDLALETRFALKKTMLSVQSLSKMLSVSKDDLNLFFFATENNGCKHETVSLIKNWTESLSETIRESIHIASENYKFKIMAKLERIKASRAFDCSEELFLSSSIKRKHPSKWK